MISEVIFDLETKSFFDDTGNFDPANLGVSIVSLYRRSLDEAFNEVDGEILSFWESDLPKIWEIFSSASRIIGYNSKRFDVLALKPYAPSTFSKLPHFDILEHIKAAHGRRVSLNAVAKETLGKGKIDDPKNAIMYWRSQKPEDLAKLQKYCEADVLITRDIYDFGLKNKILKFKDFWNDVREIPVDFSYPASPEVTPQPTLF